MRQKYLLLSLAFIFAAQLGAQEMKLVSNNPTQVVIKNTTANYVSEKKIVNAVSYENFSALKAIMMKEKDAPNYRCFPNP